MGPYKTALLPHPTLILMYYHAQLLGVPIVLYVPYGFVPCSWYVYPKIAISSSFLGLANCSSVSSLDLGRPFQEPFCDFLSLEFFLRSFVPLPAHSNFCKIMLFCDCVLPGLPHWVIHFLPLMHRLHAGYTPQCLTLYLFIRLRGVILGILLFFSNFNFLNFTPFFCY